VYRIGQLCRYLDKRFAHLIFLLNLYKKIAMKKLLLLSGIIMSFVSCNHINGSGNIVTEKRSAGNFEGVSAGGGIEVEVRIGAETKVEVEADDNLQRLIETKVSGNVLKISQKDNYSISDGHYKVYVTAPVIRTVKSSGAADIKVLDVLKSNDRIELDASGAGNIKVAVDAPEVEAESSGAGNIELSGRTRDYKAKASGSGNIKSAELLSETVDADASGAGSIHTHASINIKAEASGAGTVYYRGGGSLQQKVSGAGTVKKDD
jgi:hypothetical protein